MLCKLAWGNVRRAGRDYLVYLFTLTMGVTVFYAFNTVSVQADLTGINREGMAELLGTTLSSLTYFLAAVLAFLMVYANNYIMKRRKKEFGLYQVLGMSRGRVAVIMALETAIVSVVALVLGLVLGVALSWVMTFFTASLFKAQVHNFHFFFSVQAAVLAIACLAAIFALTLVFNLGVVRKTRLISLMGASRANESIKVRNPWISSALFVAGAVLVGAAYARLLHDGFPITATGDDLKHQILQFEITTGMVCAGTVLLFFGLSGILLKGIQALRGVYWRGLNMFTVRQLAAKINTVCFSMSVISMVLFLAITSVTTGMSVVTVMNENLELYNPVDWSLAAVYNTPHYLEQLKSWGSETDGMAVATEPVDMANELKKIAYQDSSQGSARFDLDAIAGEHVQIDMYLSFDGEHGEPAITLGKLCAAAGERIPSAAEGSNSETLGLYLIPQSQYNALLKMRGLPTVDLGEDGYVVTSDMGDALCSVYNAVLSKGIELDIAGYALKPVATEIDQNASTICNSSLGGNPGSVVVPDAVITDGGFVPYGSSLLVNYKKGLSNKEADSAVASIAYRDAETGVEFTRDGKVVGNWGVSIRRTEMIDQANQMTGFVSYLGIYIGFVLVVACAAILTIQQLSSVADSAPSCRILSELGCETVRINHSVLAQQAVFFLFPLVVGVAHSVVALRVIIDLVGSLGHLSISGTVGLTCAIFLAAYGGYFLITYLMSKSIIHETISTRPSV